MNPIQSVFRGLKSGLIMLFLGLGVNAYADDKDCWAEFYDHAQYQGEHLRLQGPIELASLHSVNGENWDQRIDSIKTGEKARVTVYENLNLKLTLTEMANYPELMKALGVTKKDIEEDSELIFNEHAMIHSLADYNFHDKTRSLKIECTK
ncbi:MAG: hypothetical protein CVV13_03915 [Gammaproteobacteria bacterium HGW-Gammaproteobacteria-3]|nr:MAG: hypothetical protein CVV13_03915 [Gammaproteobacteria bacterium HGW-Gammaproteobacteria-3]